MISKGIETTFNKVYYLIKLSLYFWGLSFIGLVIFGVTPAMMTIVEEHDEANWDFNQIKWKNLFEKFKQNFKQGNQLLLFYLMVVLIIGYNLFIALQTKGLLFLVLDFVLIFVLFILILSFIINLAVLTFFEVTLIDSLKLSVIQFFTKTKECFLLIFGLIIVSVITYKFPGLILFISTGLLAGVISTSTKRMFQNILVD
ncbi:DUF624 domain-containing protein [Carnobacterium antarcticum]|uniref:DUF624 domain-containing protein n=1 Tax=Carnobacterium antarcticum TaxID=2126436 RepID=A0ABW4NQF2_9LACT|nr:DUF624 domain-containing protein [Carnobacterium sp. CP1]ALV21416.1 hypothetical protein NY10_801 [Carnobacterium sp. CP1]